MLLKAVIIRSKCPILQVDKFPLVWRNFICFMLPSLPPAASPEDTSAKAPLMSALGGNSAESLVMSASAGNVLLAEQMRSLKAHGETDASSTLGRVMDPVEGLILI